GRHLVDLGHRAFAILAWPDDVSTSDDRISGFRRAIAPYSVEIFHGPLTVESGAELAIAAMHGAPTAIFAVNNFLAIGALNALRRSNVRIPE
ncbi:substrate-binding domain-containing protein, partial [Acinetobacter baumannii]